MSERRGRRRWLLVSGVIVLIGFIVLGVGLWFAADARYDDNVAAFARAPVGCETTLEFDRSGEFVLYIETTGKIDGLDGDCDLTDRYDRSATGLPQPELTLRDPGGEELVLDSTGGVDYDTGGFVGTAYRLVDIVEEGDHVLVVGGVDGEAFAMSIGGDPRRGHPASKRRVRSRDRRPDRRRHPARPRQSSGHAAGSGTDAVAARDARRSRLADEPAWIPGATAHDGSARSGGSATARPSGIGRPGETGQSAAWCTVVAASARLTRCSTDCVSTGRSRYQYRRMTVTTLP